jgi:hypothetical protein
MMPLALLRQHLGSAFLQEPLDGAPLRPDLVQTEHVGTFASDHDEIHAFGQEAGPCPEALAAEPLGPVAPDGGTHFPPHDEAEAAEAWWRRLHRHEQREVLRADAAPRPLRTDELPVGAEPAVAPERERRHRERYFL